MTSLAVALRTTASVAISSLVRWMATAPARRVGLAGKGEIAVGADLALARLTQSGARTVATTHHGTLKAFAHTAAGVANGSMVFDRATLAPTYRFQPGVPGSSYAFEIASRVGLDETVVSEARRLKVLEDENAKLKRMLADSMLDNVALKDLLHLLGQAGQFLKQGLLMPVFCIFIDKFLVQMNSHTTVTLSRIKLGSKKMCL